MFIASISPGFWWKTITVQNGRLLAQRKNPASNLFGKACPAMLHVVCAFFRFQGWANVIRSLPDGNRRCDCMIVSVVIALLMSGCVRSKPHLSNPSADGLHRKISFFVATNGNDAWSGTLSAPNRKGTDGPLATPPRAIRAARQKRFENPGAGPITVFLRNGTYFPSAPWMLSPEDSGLTIAAYKNEKPAISGGRRITSWEQVTVQDKKLWAADLPEV